MNRSFGIPALRATLVVGLLTGLVACKDEDNAVADTGNDTDVADATDTTDDADAIEEVGEDADAIEEVGEDADTDVAEEVGEDVDATDTIDDTDAETDTGWPFDYPEPDCTTDDECDGDAVCLGGGCVAPVTPEEYVFGEHLGYVIELQVADGTECCFDLDGNDTVDNTAGTLLAPFASDTEGSALEQLNDYIVRGLTTVLIEIDTEEDTDRVGVALIPGSNDLDSDGAPDDSWEDRVAGLGVFLALGGDFGAYGPELQYAVAELDEAGFLQTTEAGFDAMLRVPLPCSFRWDEAESLDETGARCRGEQLQEIGISRLRAEGEVELDEGVFNSVDVVEGEETVGGVRLGGYIHLDAVATLMSASYADACGCAGIARDEDLIVSSTDSGSYLLSCTRTFSEEDLSECHSGQRQCAGINDFCGLLELASNAAEYDADGDGIDDSVSFGARARVVGASLAEDPLYPGREDCRTAEDTDMDGLAQCDDPECWDDANCGWTWRGEWCHDGFDDDGDDLVDCDDPQCDGNRACTDL